MFQPRHGLFISRSKTVAGGAVQQPAAARAQLTFRRQPPVMLRASHDISGSSASLERSLRSDAIAVRLFCAWVFLQCFFYPALPYLRWNLGIGVNVTPDKLVLIAMLLVVAVRSTRSDNPLKASSRAARIVGSLSVAFTIVALTSWGVNGADATNRTFAELTRVLNLAFFPALTYFVARRLRYTRAMLEELLRFFGALGIYLAVTAIAEHYNVTALVFPKYILDPGIGVQFGRSRGPFVNTIGNGGMLLFSFVVLACISASSTGGKRLLTLSLAILLVPAIYFTETRSVWLGFAMLATTLATFRTPLRTVGGAVIGILLIAFLLGIGSKFSAFDQTLFSRRQVTVDYRLDNYQMAWNAFRANPVFGLGYGKFQTEWRNYSDVTTSRLRVGLDDGNHSTLLGILADLGLAGAIPFIGMVVCAVFVCIMAFRRLRDSQAPLFERSFAVVAIGALQIFIVLGLTSDLRTSPTVNITAFWFVGVISSMASAWHDSMTQHANVGDAVRPRRWSSRGGRTRQFRWGQNVLLRGRQVAVPRP
jgi:O-antigen ligase